MARNNRTMTSPLNPAIDAFLRAIGVEKIWGEVLIRARNSFFELTHVTDREVPSERLRRIAISDARQIAMFTATRQFRPLHASPDLQRGWLLVCEGREDLWRALQEFYPGSVADWYVAQSSSADVPVTNYREFTNRQTGMYRITQLLNDEQAANVTRAACHARFCLKQRRWTVSGLEADRPGEKSEIVCLEPCAVLLELARKAARIEQEEKVAVEFSRSELESFIAAVERTVAESESGEKVGNMASPRNQRRLQLLLEKFKQEASGKAEPED